MDQPHESQPTSGVAAHAILLDPGIWNLLGTADDDAGTAAVHGTATVRNHADHIEVEIRLETADQPPRTIADTTLQVRRASEPADPPALVLGDPARDALAGHLVPLEDAVVVVLVGPDGRTTAGAALRRLAPEIYELRAAALRDGRSRGTWSLRATLRRDQAPGVVSEVAETRTVAGAPERLAARRFNQDHPGRPIILTRLVRRPEGVVVMVATGTREALERHYYAVDLDAAAVREIPAPEGEPT